MKRVVFLAALSLTACAGHVPPPRVEIQKVEVPVDVMCAVAPTHTANFADSPEAIKAAPNIYEEVKLLIVGRLQRNAVIAELRAANAGCRPPDPG